MKKKASYGQTIYKRFVKENTFIFDNQLLQCSINSCVACWCWSNGCCVIFFRYINVGWAQLGVLVGESSSCSRRENEGWSPVLAHPQTEKLTLQGKNWPKEGENDPRRKNRLPTDGNGEKGKLDYRKSLWKFIFCFQIMPKMQQTLKMHCWCWLTYFNGMTDLC